MRERGWRERQKEKETERGRICGFFRDRRGDLVVESRDRKEVEV